MVGMDLLDKRLCTFFKFSCYIANLPSASLVPIYVPPSNVCRRRQWHPNPVLLPGKSQARSNPRMEEPGRLQSMGSLRVGHD